MIDLKVISNRQYVKFKKKNKFVIFYTVCSSPFGECLIGTFGDRICHLSFIIFSTDTNLKALKGQWPGASLINQQNRKTYLLKNIFQNETKSLKVLVRGTIFEKHVWQTLINIQKGKVVSYKDVAIRIGKSNAVRAVANAISKNFVGFIVPCHRVINNNGDLHKFKWSSSIKKKLLQNEGVFFEKNIFV